MKTMLIRIAEAKLPPEDQGYVLTLLEGVPNITEANIGEILTDIVGWLSADDPVKAYEVTIKSKTTAQLAADAEAIDHDFVRILNSGLENRNKAKKAVINFASLVMVAGLKAI